MRILKFTKKIKNDSFLFWLILLLVFTFIIKEGHAFFSTDIQKTNENIIQSVSCYYDNSNEMSIDDVLRLNEGIYTENLGTNLTFHSTSSAIWTKIKVDNKSPSGEDNYLFVSNTTLKELAVYLPVMQNEKLTYKMLVTGWASDKKEDEGFVYPIFKLSADLADNQYIYVRTRSPFSQNYCLDILSYHKAEEMKLQYLLWVGILFGMLFFMIVSNFIQYIQLKDNIHLVYILYLTLLIVYEGILSGILRVLNRNFTDALVSETVIFGLLMLSSALLFHSKFLNLKKTIPVYYRIYLFIILFSLIDILLYVSGAVFLATKLSVVAIVLMTLIGSFVSFVAFRKKISQSSYFLVGWLMMFGGLVIFLLRYWGIVPNDRLSLLVLLITAVFEALSFFTALVNRIQHLKNENKEKDVAFLRSQIKPHFLFNTLNTIQALTIHEPGKARELISNLSQYLHGSFVFENENGRTPLENELSIVKAYVAIEKERFGDKMSIEYDLDDCGHILVPMLIIQPLVENAIRHGVIDKPDTVHVKLSVKAEKQRIRICITDDGIGIPKEVINRVLSGDTSGIGVGLINIERRLMDEYGHGLIFESELLKGTTITFYIPDTNQKKEKHRQ